ncbi:Hypothetical protein TES1_0646 [Thermococcus paralvinellae]|uniref:Integrase SSV1 C-terminal domain-containing protein n=1 Tax=Thermococcus paralvinellae TaxID=582419 RepID=W0I1Z6_9EURY|nr:Hypothetical protein TES1_0646 [Thermococcus paralvinellae]
MSSAIELIDPAEGLFPSTNPLSSQGWVRNSKKFQRYLRSKVTEETVQQYMSGLTRFFAKYKKIEGSLDLKEKISDATKPTQLAMRNYIHFLYYDKQITRLERDELLEVIKIKKTGIRTIFISDDDIIEAFKVITTRRAEKYRPIFLLTLYSGARLRTIIRAVNNFDVTKIVKIDNELGRYEINNINSNKKEFYIYAPIELFLEASKYQYDYKLARKRITYGNVSANTLRKYFYTKATELGIPEGVIDFIQSRSTKSVGVLHYLDKVKLADKYYPKIFNAIREVLREAKK